METNFQLFGAVHFAILGGVVVLALVLKALHRRFGSGTRGLNFGLAAVIALETIAWDIDLALHGNLSFPHHLPVEFCDLTLYLTVVALITLKPAVFDLAYYAALAGCGMALLTPNLLEPFPSPAYVQYFIDHGLPMVAVLYLVWTRQARPRKGSVIRMMVAVNLLALAEGTLDWVFKANYMYLCEKPVHVSLLSFMGRWPWYIVTAEGVALGLFVLLYLPFWRGAAAPVAEIREPAEAEAREAAQP
jgi:hypothetical integral membrane protein (TIGR02206 family)